MTLTLVANRLTAAVLVTTLVTILTCLAPAALRAQSPGDAPIKELVARLDRGETEAVRRDLPEYVTKYQNHPGLLYVQARVATDGIEAAKLYQSVIDNYPTSEWADDALFNLYEYYYAMGLYKTAELKMQQLRKEYPQSEHLTGHAAAPVAANTQPDTKTAPPTSEPSGAAKTPAESATGQSKDANAVSTGAAATGGAVAATPKDQSAGQTAAQSSQPVASPAGTEPYTLQVGAFSTSENAQKQKAFFEERGYAAEITNRVRSGKSLYLVWVGSYANADAARKTLKEIQSRYNITPIVVER